MDTQHHDDGVGAAIAGSLGGFVSWARSPDGWRKLLARIISGLGCAYLANAVIKYYYPDVPYDFRYGLSFIAGVVSSVIVEFALRAANRLTSEAERRIDGRLGLPPAGAAHDGRANPTPGPAADYPRLPAVVAVVEVPRTDGRVAGNGVVPHHGVGGEGAVGAGGQ